MKKILTIALLSLGFSSFKQAVVAQVSINVLPTTYSQNFDSLGNANVIWFDNITLPGWFLTQQTNAVTNLVVSDGNGGSFDFYNYGSVGAPDRALGSIASVDTTAFYGLRFTNASLQTITNMVIAYTGEQWRVGNLNDVIPDTLQFFFRVGGTDFLADTNNVGWTPVPTLNFNSPQNPGGPGVAVLDGNNTTNRTLVLGNILTMVAPGEEVWLRWFDKDDLNGDHGLAIDDLSVEFQGPSFVLILPLDATVELKKPKLTKTLKVPKKGFPIKGLIKTTNTVSEVSYFAFGGTNEPTNAVFKVAGKLKEFKKGKKFKQGYKYLFKHKGSGNKPGEGITESPVTLIIRAKGTQGSNAASLNTNFVFTDVKIK
ncbi:MAG: hypothetical protein K1X66_08625 [Verrucomicrobiae bacterium]|nr:hypothetical protein [Verrucomicrobiae bacterium]